MRHASVQQLSAFVDGALVGVSRELVTRHLASCTSCRERYALWMANDEALHRVLSWEPDERTLEQWSSRIEMTITAERKGLPRPEFTEQLHPVIAPAPEVDVERLNSAVQSAHRARRGELVPAPVVVPPPVKAEPPEVQPAAPAVHAEPAVHAPSAMPEPAPAAEAAMEGRESMPKPGPAPAAPPMMSANEPPPPPVRAPAPEPVASAPPTSGNVPPWSEIELPAAENWSEPRSTHVVSAYERAAEGAEAAQARARTRAARRWRVRRRAAGRPVLAAALVVLLIVLAGSPLVPEVIRIRLPEHWGWRLPRVEFVRHGKEKETPELPSDAMTRYATRVAAEPVIVPPAPIPVPVESTTTSDHAAADSVAAAEKAAAEKAAALASRSITEPRPAPPKRAKEKKKPAPPPEPEPEVLTWPESPGTIVPTRVTTSVVTTAAPSKPAPKPAPPAPVESEADWPLLCGTVVDGAGEPFEGVLVVLPVNALSVRTDRRGRFCVACPPGSQPIRVEAPGQETYMRTVELTSGMVEIRISLTPQ